MTYEELELVLGVAEAELLFMHFVAAPVSYLILDVLDKTPMVELLAIIKSIRLEQV